MKVALLERIAYADTPNVSCAQATCLETGELLARWYSDSSQDEADRMLRREIAPCRVGVWVADAPRSVEGMPVYGVAA